MNISVLVGALLPVFFVLALGYFAGKRNAFDADQAAALSKRRTSIRPLRVLSASRFCAVESLAFDASTNCPVSQHNSWLL
jgi:hypothetical protein